MMMSPLSIGMLLTNWMALPSCKIAALFQMNNIHSSIRYSAGQLVEQKIHFQLLHDWVMGRNGIF